MPAVGTLVVHGWGWKLRPVVPVGADDDDDDYDVWQQALDAGRLAREAEEVEMNRQLAPVPQDLDWDNLYVQLDSLRQGGAGPAAERDTVAQLNDFFTRFPAADPNRITPGFGMTLVMQYSRLKWPTVVSFLLGLPGVQLSSVGRELFLALTNLEGYTDPEAETAETATVQALVAADIETRVAENDTDYTLFHRALATYPALATLQALSGTQTPTDEYDNEGYSPLTYAAMREREDAVELLVVTWNVDPNEADDKNRTPLSIACQHDGMYRVAQVLIGLGADVDLKIGSKSPLHIAAANGAVGIVSGLLNAGANPNTRSKGGETPFTSALTRGWFEVTDVLSQHMGNNVLLDGFRRANYLPQDTLLAKRGSHQQVRGLAAFLWSHKWDGLLNLWRAHGDAMVKYMRPVVAPEDYVVAISVFCPMIELRRIVVDPTLTSKDVGAARFPSDTTGSGVRLYLRNRDVSTLQAFRNRIVANVIRDHLQDPTMMQTPVPLNDEARLARKVWLSVLERMDAALNSLCRPERVGRRVYRYLSRTQGVSGVRFATQSIPEIVDRMEYSWVATSKDQQRALQFCRDTESGVFNVQNCIALVLDLEPHTLAVDISEVVRGHWARYQEAEVLLPPGVDYHVLADLHPGQSFGEDVYTDLADVVTADAHRTIVLGTRGGREPSFRKRAGPMEDDFFWRL